MTITSKDNEKLKFIRRLRERKHRERESLFVTEGEDLLDAGRTAGHEPELLLTAAGVGLGGIEAEAPVLDSVSELGSGTRAIAVWRTPTLEARPFLTPGAGNYGRAPGEGVRAVYLHGVADPGNVGAIVRTTAALADAAVVLGPGCADPYGPKAVRATMGAIFRVPIVAGAVDATPAPRLALLAHGGSGEWPSSVATVCLGAEREGLPADVVAACDDVHTIRLRAAESLNVAAAAAIALERIASASAAPTHGEGQMQ